jgi:hypothetical protein
MISASFSDPDPYWIRIRWALGSGSALRMWIRIQKGKNQPKKEEKLGRKTRKKYEN